MAFILIGFEARLQGGQVPVVYLSGLLHFYDVTKSDPDPFIVVNLYGCYEGEMLL